MLRIGTPAELERRAHLYHQWASLLSGGVPMVRALATLQRAARGRHRRMLRAVAADLERGESAGASLTRRARDLPALDTALIRVGEQTGRLAEMLHTLAESTRDQARLRREVLSGLAYPLLVLHVALLIFPVGAITSLVTESGGLGDFLWSKAVLFGGLYGAALALWGLVRFFLGAGAPGLYEQLWRCVPALGKGLRELALSRLALALDVQLNAGIGVIEAWPRAAEASGSPALHREIRGWSRALEQGATPGELTAQSRRIPDLFAEFYATGEVSGRIDEALQTIRQHYETSGRQRLKTFSEWTPRLIYFAVLLYAAYAVIGFWSGYFSQLSEFGL